MKISIIVAFSKDGGIGLKGRIPWNLSTDLKLFKQTTMGHHLVVGRKTWEAIGAPLPGRTMVVVSRQAGYQAQGCEVAGSLETALSLARSRGETECFIGGGAQIYAQALPGTDRIYLTRVQAAVEADTYFPEFDAAAWQIVESRDYHAGEKDEHDFKYQILARRV